MVDICGKEKNISVSLGKHIPEDMSMSNLTNEGAIRKFHDLFQ